MSGEAQRKGLSAEGVLKTLQYVDPTAARFNCVECAMAVDDILRGHVVVAGPTGAQPQRNAAAALSPRATDFMSDITGAEIERLLVEAGPSARGIVIGWAKGGASHAYNVANLGGKVYWLDGQHNLMAAHDPHGFSSHDMYRT